MIALHIICEGHTEEMFVNEVLAAPFSTLGIHLHPALIGRPGHLGGDFNLDRLVTDLRFLLHQDDSSYCTTFFDYYGLSATFPGKREADKLRETADKSGYLLWALEETLREEFDDRQMERFIPYVQMHEFEGLLFSDPQALATGINRPELAEKFAAIRRQFPTPEDINDSIVTAPSKRIEKLFDAYEKPTHGSLAALEMGLATIRGECPLFDRWLQTLEGLASPGRLL